MNTNPPICCGTSGLGSPGGPFLTPSVGPSKDIAEPIQRQTATFGLTRPATRQKALLVTIISENRRIIQESEIAGIT